MRWQRYRSRPGCRAGRPGRPARGFRRRSRWPRRCQRDHGDHAPTPSCSRPDLSDDVGLPGDRRPVDPHRSSTGAVEGPRGFARECRTMRTGTRSENWLSCPAARGELLALVLVRAGAGAQASGRAGRASRRSGSRPGGGASRPQPLWTCTTGGFASPAVYWSPQRASARVITVEVAALVSRRPALGDLRRRARGCRSRSMPAGGRRGCAVAHRFQLASDLLEAPPPEGDLAQHEQRSSVRRRLASVRAIEQVWSSKRIGRASQGMLIDGATCKKQ